MPDVAVTVPLILIASVIATSVLAWIVPPLRRGMMLIPWRVVSRFEIHRVLTNAWVHADIAHLTFNMLTLWFFADGVDRVLGDVRFLLLYITAAIASSLPTTVRKHADMRYASLGASGAVAAVIFSAILLEPNLRLGIAFVPIPIPGWAWAIGYLAYSVFAGIRSRDGINHEAHFWGAVYGAALTFVFEPDRAARTVQQLFS
ncbi:MAG TPA: rhomboid family intramembrane serine protease [Labilithrix sp.]